MSAKNELGRIIWVTSRDDEGTISATGANIIADAILAAGWLSPEDVARIKAEAWDEAIDEAAKQGTIQMPDNPYRAAAVTEAKP